MPADSLTVARDGDVAWLTLHRGERNLLDAELTRALADAVAELDTQGVTAMVLTGAGAVFCAGADASKLRATGTAREFADAAIDLFCNLAEAQAPVIAAVNGDALAGGFGIACAADIVIAVDGAALGTVEAALGTWPMIAQVPASRRVPPKAAIRNALTGVPFTTAEAKDLGVIDEILSDAGALRVRAAEVAREVTVGGAAARRGKPMLVGLYMRQYRADLSGAADAFVDMFGG
ncbi:enoyl-CoA hydratase/isomerase family protein [Microbacterium sp. LWS13-1.2]|uniref:Enoyl-CoA hydratase/isomerase family protein n=1 Tax=Microbacterium sp. LWS13-1.2 TaxID=3135264 RepID=A0AAU6SBH0_9MICO